MKKVTALLLSAATLLFAVLLPGCAEKENGNNNDYASTVVMKSEHYQITADVFQYFLKFTFSSFYNQYASYASSFGLDISAPMKEQACTISSSEGYTWFDYFTDGAANTLIMYLSMAEKAISEGLALTATDEAQIEKEIALVRTQAQEYGYEDTQTYLSEQYGSLITEDTLRSAFQLYMLASSYYRHLYYGYTYSQEDYDLYARENKENIYQADYVLLSLNIDVDEDASDEEKDVAFEKISQRAHEIDAAITDDASFIKLIEDYYREVYTIVPDDSEEADAQNKIYTETQLASMTKACSYMGAAYNTGNATGKWIFDAAASAEPNADTGAAYAAQRLAGEHAVVESKEEGRCDICYIVKAPYRDESFTANVRHILLSPDTYGGEEQAAEKAQQLLDEWEHGEATEESFGLLARQYTEDTASQENNGLYQNVVPGDMEDTFDKWCFEQGRKPADTGIIQTTYGYHLMYYVSEGLPVWQATADAALRQKDYDADYADIEANCGIQPPAAEVLSDMPDIIEKTGETD